MVQQNVNREELRIYALVPDITHTGGTKKYFPMGRGSASGTLALGYATEEQKDITTSQSQYTINKGAWTIQLTGKSDVSDNVQNYITMNSLRSNTDNLILDILIVFEYIHKQGEEGEKTAFALKGKAVAPLTSLGGDGQAKIQYDATLSTSGDLVKGSVTLNEAALAGVYNETDVYEESAFTKGEIVTNLDPKQEAVMSNRSGYTPKSKEEN